MIAANEVNCVKGTEAPLEGIKEAQVWRTAGAGLFILTIGYAGERAPNFSAKVNLPLPHNKIFKIHTCAYWKLNPILDYLISQRVEWSGARIQESGWEAYGNQGHNLNWFPNKWKRTYWLKEKVKMEMEDPFFARVLLLDLKINSQKVGPQDLTMGRRQELVNSQCRWCCSWKSGCKSRAEVTGGRTEQLPLRNLFWFWYSKQNTVPLWCILVHLDH